MDKKTVVRKADLIVAVAKKNGLTQVEAKEAVESLFSAIIQGVKRGPVTLPDFGAFRTQHRRARKGCNPRTGETIDIPSSTYPVFAPSERMKSVLNGSKRKSKS